MKKSIMYLTMLLIGAFIMTSCDPEEPVIIDNPIYGMQISGTATADSVYTIDLDQIIEPGSDYTVKETRTGMTYGIHFLNAGSISFKEVMPDSETVYGVADVADSTQTAEAGEPFDYQRGKLVEDGTGEFTVAEAGLYYIIVDKTTLNFWVMKINNFEINATGDKATMQAGASAEGAVFKVEAVELRAKFKARMNTGWKIIASDVVYDGTAVTEEDHVRMVISYGGSLAELTEDGDDIEVDNGGKLLDFTFTWTPTGNGIADFVVTTAEAGDLPDPTYPEQLYMVGASIGGWDWAANGIEMVPVHSNAHLFWRIVYIEAGVADAGMKFSPEMDWGPSFGIDGDATNGVYAKGSNNVPDVASSGFYMVVINLKDETIEVNPAMVYGIGDAFGSWDASTHAFTVDNTAKTITSPAFAADAELRMHTSASTLVTEDGEAVDWWQAEFMLLNGVIEYRGAGDDQARVNVTTGQTITLDFEAGTGSIQ